MNKFQQAKQISLGLTHYLRKKANISDPEIEKVQKSRYAICKLCTSHDKVNNKCDSCGCYLEIKTRSMPASCPLKYWISIGDEE